MCKKDNQMIENYKNLIEQLQFAVDRAKGKTTLTQSDIDLMQSIYRQIKRYDDDAKLK